MNNIFEELIDQKYISLDTYKKDKTSVRTPVWFVIDNDCIYITTKENTGKVKRLRNNQNVRIAICLSLIHISEPTRLGMISYAVFC